MWGSTRVGWGRAERGRRGEAPRGETELHTGRLISAASLLSERSRGFRRSSRGRTLALLGRRSQSGRSRGMSRASRVSPLRNQPAGPVRRCSAPAMQSGAPLCLAPLPAVSLAELAQPRSSHGGRDAHRWPVWSSMVQARELILENPSSRERVSLLLRGRRRGAWSWGDVFAMTGAEPRGEGGGPSSRLCGHLAVAAPLSPGRPDLSQSVVFAVPTFE